ARKRRPSLSRARSWSEQGEGHRIAPPQGVAPEIDALVRRAGHGRAASLQRGGSRAARRPEGPNRCGGRSGRRYPPTSRSGRRRLRIDYYSPWPPERSGIADYSALLLPALQARIDVNVRLRGRTARRSGGDLALYHLGNDPIRHGWIVAA